MKHSLNKAESINGHSSSSTALFEINVELLDTLCYLGYVPYTDAYRQALAGMLEAAKKDLEHLERQQDRLQAELEETVSAIVERQKEIGQFQDLWKRSMNEVIADMKRMPLENERSFTRAIAFVLKRANGSLSPIEIRERLIELGFNTDKYKSDVVSSVHTVLKRFLASDPPAVVETGEARRKKYRWIAEAGRTSGLE